MAGKNRKKSRCDGSASGSISGDNDGFSATSSSTWSSGLKKLNRPRSSAGFSPLSRSKGGRVGTEASTTSSLTSSLEPSDEPASISRTPQRQSAPLKQRHSSAYSTDEALDDIESTVASILSNGSAVTASRPKSRSRSRRSQRSRTSSQSREVSLEKVVVDVVKDTQTWEDWANQGPNAVAKKISVYRRHRSKSPLPNSSEAPRGTADILNELSLSQHTSSSADSYTRSLSAGRTTSALPKPASISSSGRQRSSSSTASHKSYRRSRSSRSRSSSRGKSRNSSDVESVISAISAMSTNTDTMSMAEQSSFLDTLVGAIGGSSGGNPELGAVLPPPPSSPLMQTSPKPPRPIVPALPKNSGAGTTARNEDVDNQTSPSVLVAPAIPTSISRVSSTASSPSVGNDKNDHSSGSTHAAPLEQNDKTIANEEKKPHQSPSAPTTPKKQRRGILSPAKKDESTRSVRKLMSFPKKKALALATASPFQTKKSIQSTESTTKNRDDKKKQTNGKSKVNASSAATSSVPLFDDFGDEYDKEWQAFSDKLSSNDNEANKENAHFSSSKAIFDFCPFGDNNMNGETSVVKTDEDSITFAPFADTETGEDKDATLNRMQTISRDVDLSAITEEDSKFAENDISKDTSFANSGEWAHFDAAMSFPLKSSLSPIDDDENIWTTDNVHISFPSHGFESKTGDLETSAGSNTSPKDVKNIFRDSPEEPAASPDKVQPSNKIQVAKLKLEKMKELSAKSLESDTFSDVEWDPAPSQTHPQLESPIAEFSFAEPKVVANDDLESDRLQQNKTNSREEVRISQDAPNDKALEKSPSSQKKAPTERSKNVAVSKEKCALQKTSKELKHDTDFHSILNIDSHEESTAFDTAASPPVSGTIEKNLPDSPTSVTNFSGAFKNAFRKKSSRVKKNLGEKAPDRSKATWDPFPEK